MWLAARETIRKLWATQLGHDDVGEQKVDLVEVLFSQGLGLGGRGRREHAIAAFDKSFLGEIANGVLVLH